MKTLLRQWRDSLNAAPLRAIRIGQIATLVLFLVLASTIVGMYRAFRQVEENSARLTGVMDRLDYLNEALTMSALMHTATGDPRWRDRHVRLSPEFDSVSSFILRVGSDAGEPGAAQRIRAASESLLDLETRAVELVRSGDRRGGLQLLAGPAYAAQKQVYTSASREIHAALRNEIRRDKEDFERRILWAGATTMGAAGFLLLLGAFTRSSITRYISSRDEAMRALAASEERYRVAGRVTQEALWEWHIADNELRWGEGIHTTFGYSREEVRPNLDWWAGRIHPEDLDGMMESLGRAVAGAGEAWSREYRFLRADGSYADVLDRGLVIRDQNGTAVRMIGSVADFTERKRAEHEIRKAREAAEAANLAKSDFLASMSHELRTPLNSVIGFSNVLRKNKGGNLRDQDLTYLERIHSNGKHLLGLINDILDLSKIEAGKIDLAITPVSLDELVWETLEQMAGAVGGRDVKLRAAIPGEVAPLETDRAKVKQVLINLVGNAIKFTEQGSVTVAVLVDPETRRPVRVDVGDTGVGIPPERLAAIFQPFVQAESGTARQYGGTGLGLAISRSLAEALGYRLEVASVPGQGSVFSLVLAAGTALDDAPSALSVTGAVDIGDTKEPGAAGRAQNGDATEPGDRLGSKLVLVIDDETDARMLLTHQLEELGCQTITATSGVQGLRMAREFRPDLITLDLLLPGISGWEILRTLKADPELCHIPVVIVSVVAGENRASVLGAVDVLEKPVEREALLAILQRQLGPESTRRVLIVDDEADARDMLSRYLSDEHVDIRTAASGREALTVLESFTPDLIVLDLLMPGMDGVGFLNAIHGWNEYRDIPVVLVTAKDLSQEEVQSLSREAMAVLGKDSELEDDLRAIIRHICAGPGAADSPGSTE